MNNVHEVFGGKKKTKKDAAQEEKDTLLKMIGSAKSRNRLSKKSLDVKTLKEKRKKADRSIIELSIAWHYDILGIHKSGIYYQPKGESALNLELMRLIDEHYLDYPDIGRCIAYSRHEIPYKSDSSGASVL